LDKKTALILLVAMLALSACFSAEASAASFGFMGNQHFSHIQQLSASAPVIFGASLHDTQPLNQPTRLEIYNFVKDNSGVHFRGICTGLGLSVGVVQYHLGVLEQSGLINSVRDGENKRFFEHQAFTKINVPLAVLMRHDTTAKILTLLAQNGSVLHRDLASCLGISSQALSWHMAQLKDAGLVSAQKVGVNVKCSLTDAEMGKAILGFQTI
jgi:predicted transcriptional regulator